MRFWNKDGLDFPAKSVTDEWPKFKSQNWIVDDITVDGEETQMRYLPTGRSVYFSAGTKNYRGQREDKTLKDGTLQRGFQGQITLFTANPLAPAKEEKPVVVAETVEDDDGEEIEFIKGTNPRDVKGETFLRVTEELENEDAKNAAQWIRDNFEGARAKVMKYKGSHAVWSDTEVA